MPIDRKLLVSSEGKLKLGTNGQLADKNCCCGKCFVGFAIYSQNCGPIGGVCCGNETSKIQIGNDCDGADLSADGAWGIYLTTTTTCEGCSADGCETSDGTYTQSDIVDPFVPDPDQNPYSPNGQGCHKTSDSDGGLSATLHCNYPDDNPVDCEFVSSCGQEWNLAESQDEHCVDLNYPLGCSKPPCEPSILIEYSNPLSLDTSYNATLARLPDCSGNPFVFDEGISESILEIKRGGPDGDGSAYPVCVKSLQVAKFRIRIFGVFTSQCNEDVANDVSPACPDIQCPGHYLKVWFQLVSYPDYVEGVPYGPVLSWEYNDPDNPFSDLDPTDEATWIESPIFDVTTPVPGDVIDAGDTYLTADWYVAILKYSYKQDYEPPDDGPSGWPP
jgi:hypothetical protein